MGRALNGDAAAWTVEHELLAALVDIAASHQWQDAMASFPRARRQLKRLQPQPIPRPERHRPSHESRAPERRHATHAELSKVFGLPLRSGYRPPDGVPLDRGEQRRPVRHRRMLPAVPDEEVTGDGD